MVAESGTGDRTRPAGLLHRPNGSRGPAPPRWPSAALCCCRSVSAGRQARHGRLVDANRRKLPWLGRVKKDQILAAIGEGTNETNFEDLRKLKKGELVVAAEPQFGR
jgi:hypothetical protein